MVRRWFHRGMRPRMVKDQRYRSTYIFGAVCPACDTGASLVSAEAFLDAASSRNSTLTCCANMRRRAMLRSSEGTAPNARGWQLDTNIVSELRKGPRCDPGVMAWAMRAPPAACYLGRVTVAAIVFGIERVSNAGFRAELEGWLRDGVRVWFGVRILEVDETVLLA